MVSETLQTDGVPRTSLGLTTHKFFIRLTDAGPSKLNFSDLNDAVVGGPWQRFRPLPQLSAKQT